MSSMRKRPSPEEKMIRRGALKRMLAYIRPYRLFFVLSLVSAAVVCAAQLLVPVFSGAAIDAMIDKGQVDFTVIAQAVLKIGIAVALSAGAQWLLAYAGNRLTFSVVHDLRDEAIAKLQKLPLSYLDAHPSGDLLSRIVADAETIGDGLLMGFSQLFTGVIMIAGILVIMLRLNPAVAAIVVILTPFSIFVASFIVKRTSRFFKAQSEVRGEETAFINESIEGLKVMRSFGHEEASLAQFDEVNERLRDVSMKAVFYSSLTNPSTRLVNNVVYAAVVLVCALTAVGGGMTVGGMSIFLSYASQYAKPFNEISSVITELENALACAARIFALLDEAEEPAEAPDAAAFEAEGNVDVENVSFRYVPERPLIEDFKLSVKAGQRIAIVGPTGCGKTTLINLLMRFYDVDGGRILVEGTDIRSMTRHGLRKNYGMVLQDTWLKRGTVRENIAFGRPDATEEEVIAAAKAAHIHSFIKRLPQGYDTVITENGGNLSQGQKQLLCIARVMLNIPPMLILDEATSSIDTRTEINIQSAFARMMQGRTSFIVAHRLSTIREADVILVMRDGHIVEQGNHDELMAQGGFYAKLYKSQFALS
ncbi:MAG: ABC transporter ATP-binding protein [Lachnospiraceae bacterium]|nr:ABC transporter ATP-binding protein [Lachnospiraceae bacterium]